MALIVMGGCRPPAEMPARCGGPRAPLAIAAWAGDLAQVSALIEGGADVHERDELSFDPLHWAVAGGQAATTRLLLERGADPNGTDDNGMTPLHWAAMTGHAELIDLLLRRGARIDARNAYGMTPLHEAANPAVVSALLDHDAERDAVDQRGRTPLHVARNGDVAQRLLERHADIRIRARDRRTALEVAILDTLEPHGLTVYTARAPARLTGSRARVSFLVRNVEPCPIEDLVFVVRSPAAWAEVVPLAIARLGPGQLATVTITLHLRPEITEGVYPVTVTASVGKRAIGDLALSVDTRRGQTPEDRGMIRLGKGAIRPTPSRLRYLAFLAVPLLIAIWWLVARRRAAARRRSPIGE